jgi:hypothetical protein
MRILRSRYLMLFLSGCALAGLGWCLQSYVQLVRLEATLVDARARVEAASRTRLALVENLLRDTDRASAGALAQVQVEVGQVRALDQRPDGLDSEQARAAFRQVQTDLSAALESVWSMPWLSRNPSAGAAVSDLRPEIERLSSALERALDDLERRSRSFRDAVNRFPGSLVARIPRREGPPPDAAVGVSDRAAHGRSPASAAR